MNIFPKPKLIAVGQLNEKSQLVIPKEAREAIGIGPNDRVIIALAPFGKAIVIAKPEALEEHLEDMMTSTNELRESIEQVRKLKEK